MTLDQFEKIAKKLIYKYLKKRWKFEWIDTNVYFGSTSFEVIFLESDNTKFKLTNRAIQFSKPFCELNNFKINEDTILHEIAHAIDAETRGRTRHDNIWKAIFKSLGGSGDVSSADGNTPGNYTYICPYGHKITRLRKLSKNIKYSCTLCSKEYNKKYELRLFKVKK